MKYIVATVFSVTLVLITLILSVSYTEHHKNESLKSNVESAIVKGIDPIAVRCAYAKQDDGVCIAYGVSKGNVSASYQNSTVKK